MPGQVGVVEVEHVAGGAREGHGVAELAGGARGRLAAPRAAQASQSSKAAE